MIIGSIPFSRFLSNKIKLKGLSHKTGGILQKSIKPEWLARVSLMVHLLNDSQLQLILSSALFCILLQPAAPGSLSQLTNDGRKKC